MNLNIFQFPKKNSKNKRVTFYIMNKVIFIPKREEIIKVINKRDLWWSLEEYKFFNRSFTYEIEIFRQLYPFLKYKDLCKIIFEYYDDNGDINFSVILDYKNLHLQKNNELKNTFF